MNRPQLFRMGAIATFCVVSFFFFTGLWSWQQTVQGANSKLMANSPFLFLETYYKCFFVISQCGSNYKAMLDEGSHFPMDAGVVWLSSVGAIVVAFYMFRPKPQLYDGSLGTLKDVKDLRTKNWLDNPAAATCIVLGQHVTVPESGRMRRRVLRGHSRKGIDPQMMLVKPNYGGRSELPLGAVFGTTRSGKTTHLIAQALRWTDSIVALDVKGEIYDLTAGLAAKRIGKERIFVISPEGEGHQFDPLAELMHSSNGVATAANIIAAPEKETGAGIYFAEKAAQGLEAAFHAARFIGQPPFDFLYELVLAGGMGSFVERLRKIDDPVVRLALNKFLDPHGGDDFNLQRALDESSLTNSWSTMIKSLSPFLGENARWMMRRSDFRASDLMKRPTNVYLKFPETTLKATARVYDLIVTALTTGMFDYAGELKREKPKVRVLLLLDELNAAPVYDLPDTYSTASARHVTIIIYCQTLEQLEEHYGSTGQKTILGNCGFRLYYKTETMEIAKQVSEIAGKVSRTEQRKSRRWRPLPTFEAPTISEGNQSREVITPEEVDTLGGEKRQVIAVKVTGKPLTIARRVEPFKTRRLKKLIAKYSAPEIPVPKSDVLKGQPAVRHAELPSGEHNGHTNSLRGTEQETQKKTAEQRQEGNQDDLPLPEVGPGKAQKIVASLENLEQRQTLNSSASETEPGGDVTPPDAETETTQNAPTLPQKSSNETAKPPRKTGGKLNYRPYNTPRKPKEL